MSYRNRLLSMLVIPMLIAGAAGTVHAAGYALFTQGASALGQGNAVTAHNDSPNAIFYNPALMAKLDGTQIDLGTTMVYATHKFESHDIPGYNSSNRDVFFPSTVYVTHKLNDDFTVGMGIFNPFGLGTHWSETWEGRYHATKSDLTTFNFNPVVSYRISPSLSMAAGLDIIYLDATLQRKVPGALFNSPYDVNVRFDGDGVGVGANAGVAWDINNRMSLGASFRTPVEVKVHGHSSTSAPGFDTRGNATITLPAQLTVGFAYQATNPLTIEAGVRWEEWSSFPDLTIYQHNNVALYQNRKWHDTLGVNFGGKYRLSDVTSVSAGYIFGSNPVPGYTFEASIPDSDTHIFCLGTSWYLQPWRIDLAYAYQLYAYRTKNNSVGTVPHTPIPAANGKYESDAHLFALNLGYRF